MFTTNILMATWLIGSAPGLRISGESVCESGASFDEAMVTYGCPNPVATIDVRFYRNADGRYCAAVGESASGGCFGTCEGALRIAAIRAGEAIDASCLPGPAEPPSTAVQDGSDEAVASEAVEIRRSSRSSSPVIRVPRTQGIKGGLTFATAASAAHFGRSVAGGFMTSIVMSHQGTHFAAVGGFADITPTRWYWQAGIELCHGGVAGAWEWNGCVGLGAGEHYVVQKASCQYPWGSFAHSTGFRLTHELLIRAVVGGQMSIADPRFGMQITDRLIFNPFVTLGFLFQIPDIPES